jgi:hypothetical protein
VGVRAALALAVFTTVTLTAVVGPATLARLWRRAALLVARVAPRRPAPPQPRGRPIEDVARDVHRLGVSFRHVPDRVSFARFEARRRAYDVVLTEACLALEVSHLLGVLPPGPELDAERDRVEAVLDGAGMRLNLSA